MKQLQAKLVDLQTCHDLIKKHQTSLQRVINDLGDFLLHCLGDIFFFDFSDDDISRALQEKSTLFLITSDAMNVAANEFLQLSRNTHRHWEKLINVERQQRRRLEETVEALGKYILKKGVTFFNDYSLFCLTFQKLFDLL